MIIANNVTEDIIKKFRKTSYKFTKLKEKQEINLTFPRKISYTMITRHNNELLQRRNIYIFLRIILYKRSCLLSTVNNLLYYLVLFYREENRSTYRKIHIKIDIKTIIKVVWEYTYV